MTQDWSKKAHWTKIAKLAKILERDKYKVNYCFNSMSEDAIERALELIPEAITELQEHIDKAKNFKDRDEPVTEDKSQLKLALWFVDKVGGTDNAIRLLKKLKKII